MRTGLFVAVLVIVQGLAGPYTDQAAEIPRIVVLGIDGLGTENVWRDTYNGVPPPEVPNIDDLASSGAYSLRARIDPLNFSGPNWMGMLTGSLSSEHGVDSNGCTTGLGLPTVFDVLHRAFERHTLAVVYEWDRIGCYADPAVVSRRQDTSDERDTANAVIDVLTDASVIFVLAHFDRLDGAGHDYGGNSLEYKNRIESIDQQIGRIRAAIATSPRADSTFVIITSDHGHRPDGGGHASADDPVPFIVSGPGVERGAIEADVRNNQVAPLVAYIFGLAPSPEWSAPLAPFHSVVRAFR